MFQEEKLTLLTDGQVWGTDQERQLDVLKKYGTESAITDLVILTGGYCEDDCTYMAPDDNGLTGRTGWVYTQSLGCDGAVRGVFEDGSRGNGYHYIRIGAIRPALLSSSILNISPNRVRGYNGTEEIEYGEYPQSAVNSGMQRTLENAFDRRKLRCTRKSYTFDSTPHNEYLTGFNPVVYKEYEYNGSKYIRVEANSNYDDSKFELSNGEEYENGNYVWVKVEPVRWLIDDKTGILVAKKGILSGIRFHPHDRSYNGDFNTTDMKEYLDKYMSKDLFHNIQLRHASQMTPKKRKNLKKDKKN